MGSAISFPARDNGHEVRLVGTMLDREIVNEVKNRRLHPTLKRALPEGVQYYQYEELGVALRGVDLVISGVSSFGVDWFADEILPILPENVPLLSVTKGLVNAPNGTLITYPELYELKAPRRDYCAIGGPCTSYELADRAQTHVCFCGMDISILRRLLEIMHTEYYHISLSTDVIGVEFAVALKNAYALAVTLAVGMAKREGLSSQYNSQAALFGQSIAEMRKLLALFGGGAESIVYGAGDLYVTVFGGRTRFLGTLLGEGIHFAEATKQLSEVTLESVVIASRVAVAVREKIKQGAAFRSDYPLLLHINEIISANTEVDVPWDEFQVEMFE